MIKRVRDRRTHEFKWYVMDSTGKKVLGSHPSRKAAVAQMVAIELSRNKGKAGKDILAAAFKKAFKDFPAKPDMTS